MEIIKEETKYYIKFNNEIIAYLNYEETKSEIVIYSVFVNKEYRGENLGLKLIEEIIILSDKTSKVINPLCTYAKKVLEKR